MKIVLLESLGISEAALWRYVQPIREAGHEFESFERDLDVEQQIERVRYADVLMVANMPLKKEVVENSEHLKFIDVAFTGVDHIPLDAAREKGIAVSNASGYSNDSVAELVLGMTISLLRKLSIVDGKTRAGENVGCHVGRELKGKTVGVIGTGAIGRRVAQLFQAFGCEVLGYDTFPQAVPDVKQMSLEDLLSQSDIVTLHCPLNETTRGLINRETIAMMKDGAILINAARGPIVDTNALIEALDNEKLGAAGIDVYETEPPLPENHPLLSAPNTILTPHIAYLSEESMEKRAAIVFQSLHEWMNGNQINKII